MNLIEGVLGDAQHANIRAEFFNEIGDYVVCGGARADAQAFGRHLLTGVLKVEAHDAVKFEFLELKKIEIFSVSFCIDIINNIVNYINNNNKNNNTIVKSITKA